MLTLLFLATSAAVAPVPTPNAGEAIVVTASRVPLDERKAPVSATVFGREELEALALPLASDVLRLAPGVSVAQSGPRGSQAQLRIRGAEANHSLLFVDGIRFNDPAAGNEARFELLAGDSLSRIEIVRGPQSALWGSEALGGVIAVDNPDPERSGVAALAEYGGLDSSRLAAQAAIRAGDFALSATAGRLRSDGIDSFGAGGERDGFDNRHAGLKAVFTPAAGIKIGAVGHWIEGESQFDGYDPATFRLADTLDSTANRIRAARLWAEGEAGGWSFVADASILGSTNRNRLGAAPLNRTAGRRTTVGAQGARSVGRHRLVAAVEHEAEDFRARDQSFFGMTDQDRSRSLTAFVGEWRGEWSDAFATDLALRHDRFSAFADATTFRAGASLRPAAAWRLHAAYGEGIAQPTFYDLYGFFPGSFVGNPALKPESSRGWELGLRWQDGGFAAGATAFSNRLSDEIVDTFDPVTFLSSTANASGRSRRRGIELDASYRPSPKLLLAANYTLLDAGERQVAGAAAVREVRRPRHSANLIASGRSGRLGWGASAAYVGARQDTDFDLFPARKVRLGDYLLASLTLAWRLREGLEAYARAENALAADYRDAVGYETPGRTVHAGLRLRFDP
jgi:vitamin B12 transporter